MLRMDQTRLIVSLDDLRDYAPQSRELVEGYVPYPRVTCKLYNGPPPCLSLLKSPNEFVPALETALSESVRLRRDPEKHDIEGKEYRVGFRGSFGDHHLNPRTLRASHLGNMISVEGIVTRCTSTTKDIFKGWS